METGDLTLKFDAEAGSLAVWAHGTHKLPICPVHYGLILGDAHPELERLGDAFSNLRPRDRFVGKRAAALQAQLAEGVDGFFFNYIRV